MKEELGTCGALVGMATLVALFGGIVLAIYPGWAAFRDWLPTLQFEIKVVEAVSAIGTWVAAVSALWLAQKETRRRREEDFDRATLHAATLSVQLAYAAEQLTRCAVLYGLGDRADIERENQSDDFDFISDVMNESLFIPSSDDLSALLPLDGNCARKIARGYDILADVKRQILDKWRIEFFRNASTAARREMLSRWYKSLDESASLISSGSEQVKMAAELGIAQPRSRELINRP